MADDTPSRRTVAIWALVVFVLAVCLRVPSCYESFWLDELHTAWAIWGDLGEVSQRAAAGNQTPLYFQLTWFWKQLVGESEVALRFSSVLATSLASALLVIALTRTTNRLSAGVLSGTILAVESNSIFFGTELRPYAGVMLCSVIAVWMAVELIHRQSPHRSGIFRLVFVMAACLAALLHPTAIVTIAVLASALFMIELITWWRAADRRFQFHVTGLIGITVVVASIIALVNSSLTESWENRDHWRAFGRARDPIQLWTMWPWIAIAILPLVLGVGTVWQKPKREIFAAVLPLAVGVTATSAFFVASYFDVVPLWHRRYFIGALPLLAWTAGAIPVLGLPDRGSWPVRVIAAVFVVAIVAVLMRHQGTARQLRAGNTTLAGRGEDWRGAIGFLREHRKQRSDQAQLMTGINSVWLDSDLIEAIDYVEDTQLSELAREYLRFPVSGPYRVPGSAKITRPNHKVVWLGGLPNGLLGPETFEQLRRDRQAGDALWIISRGRGKSLIQQWCRSLWIAQFNKPELHQFGQIWVAKIPEPSIEQIQQWLDSN